MPYKYRPDECDHENTKIKYDYEEVEEKCIDCGSKRPGFIAWGDWENESD